MTSFGRSADDELVADMVAVQRRSVEGVVATLSRFDSQSNRRSIGWGSQTDCIDARLGFESATAVVRQRRTDGGEREAGLTDQVDGRVKVTAKGIPFGHVEFAAIAASGEQGEHGQGEEGVDVHRMVPCDNSLVCGARIGASLSLYIISR